ncbi:MAG: antibiotic biosynthesis monooxygenase [Paludibacteraceae bacterium]|nr:antibiotic biosynthesis monooxygenase [Paludibacteraceae bacterium]
MRKFFIFAFAAVMLAACNKPEGKMTNDELRKTNELITRIAEIEVNEGYLEEYLAAAHNVGTMSVESEEGVICIFPMQVKDSPNTIRIVEIYRNEEAYQAHLQTPHFLEYKQGTLHMVKSLRLVATEPLAPEAMPLIFKKY